MNLQLKPKSRIVNILIQELGNKFFIYDLLSQKAFCLNETCAMVWQECNGTKTIDEILEVLNCKTQTLNSLEVVEFALESLKKNDLLAPVEFSDLLDLEDLQTEEFVN